jgi:hypothetical protein
MYTLRAIEREKVKNLANSISEDDPIVTLIQDDNLLEAAKASEDVLKKAGLHADSFAIRYFFVKTIESRFF